MIASFLAGVALGLIAGAAALALVLKPALLLERHMRRMESGCNAEKAEAPEAFGR